MTNAGCLSRRGFVSAAATAIVSAAMPAALSAAPNERITVIVGFPPGGAPDLIARVVADILQQRTGRTTVVENRPGASGQIAMETVRNAQGPASTIILAPAEAVTLQPHVKKSLPYDVATDFVPIAPLSSNDYGLAVGPLSKTADLKDFVAWCKANPKNATFGTPGVGTPHHLLGERLGRLAGFEYTHLAYRGGNDILQDVQGGTVSSLIAALPLLITRHKPGTLTVIATTGKTRNPGLPNVPTFAELGYPQMTADGIMALFASAKMPAAELSALSGVVSEAVKTADFAKNIARFGQEPFIQPATEFRQRLLQDSAAWKTLLTDIKFKPED